MGEGLFGRTNRKVPRQWLKLKEPLEPNTVPDLCKFIGQVDCVTDITYQPALFGRFLPAPAKLLCELPATIQFADTEQKAFDLANGALIQILSAIGRSKLDFLTVDLDTPLEDHQLEGLLKATSAFIEEDTISFLGLSVRRTGRTALNNWKLHDAFSFCVFSSRLPVPIQTEIKNLAESRRLGLVLDIDAPNVPQKPNSLSETVDEKQVQVHSILHPIRSIGDLGHIESISLKAEAGLS